MTAASLYQRLGGQPAIAKIANDIVDLHCSNPVVRTRFEGIDVGALKKHARDFICAGTGGEQAYHGRDMLTAHKGMNVSEQEFLAVVDDVLKALEVNDVGEQERTEMLAILYSMKSEIIRV